MHAWLSHLSEACMVISLIWVGKLNCSPFEYSMVVLWQFPTLIFKLLKNPNKSINDNALLIKLRSRSKLNRSFNDGPGPRTCAQNCVSQSKGKEMTMTSQSRNRHFVFIGFHFGESFRWIPSSSLIAIVLVSGLKASKTNLKACIYVCVFN